jgi:hypothetical protein
MKRCLNRSCTALALALLLVTTAQAATVVWPAVRFGPYESYDSTHAIGSGISQSAVPVSGLKLCAAPAWKATKGFCL